MSPIASGLYVGTVRHRRHRPRAHAFAHRTYHTLIDLDELPRLDRDVAAFGYRRPAITGFHDRDHFGPVDLPSRAKLRRLLADRSVALPDGPVRVLTNLRVLGHVFNPVSWWFCHHPDGSLGLVVAEVNNTFGESHAYLLDALDHRPDGTVRAWTDKRFHVSPFLPVDGLDYAFTFVITAERVVVRMVVTDGQGVVFDATQDGRRRELRSATLARTLLSHPLMTLRTLVLIHLQAARLFRRGVPFIPKPIPPDDGYLRRHGS